MRNRVWMATMLFAFSGMTHAANFNYSNLEVGYGEVDENGDALFFGGAVDLQRNYGLIGSYYSVDFDNDADGNILTIGLQFHKPINPKTDLVVSAMLIEAEVSRETRGRFGGISESVDDTGILLRAGMRFQLQQKIHLEGDLSYITNDLWEDDELGIKFGARFYLDRQLSLGVGVASDQELDGIYLSGRYDL